MLFDKQMLLHCDMFCQCQKGIRWALDMFHVSEGVFAAVAYGGVRMCHEAFYNPSINWHFLTLHILLRLLCFWPWHTQPQSAI